MKNITDPINYCPPKGWLNELAYFYNTSADLFCVLGADGYYKNVNPAFLQLLGYTNEEVSARPFIDFVHPDDKEISLQRHQDIVDNKVIQSSFENRLVKKDGTCCWLSWTEMPKKVDNLLYATAKNITDKKEEEEKLIRANKEINGILESIKDGFFSIGNDWRVRYWNKQAETFTGKNSAEVLGRRLIEVFPDGFCPIFHGHLKTAFEQRAEAEHELYYQPMQQWVEIKIYPAEDCLSVYFRFITEKKKEQKRIKDLNTRYELIIEATSALIWEWEVGAVEATWHGKKMAHLLGYEEDDVKQYDRWYQNIHPEDVAQTQFVYENAIKNKEHYYTIEHRMLTKQGSYLHVRNRCQIFWKEDEPYKVIGVMEDITKEKLAEAACIENQLSYKHLFDNAPLPQLILDVETLRFLKVNGAAIKHYGYSESEFMQMTAFDLRSAEYHNQLLHLSKEIKNTDSPLTYTVEHLKKNKEAITVELYSNSILYKGSKAKLITINDITEKVKLQEKVTRLKILRQRRIAQATICAQEKERKFIGKELHDNINQILASAMFYFQLAKRKEAVDVEFIEKGRSNIITAIEEIRALSKSLTIPRFPHVAFVDAVHEIASPYLLSNVFELHLTHEGNLDALNDKMKIAIYRIIQEQLNNIIKHASAKNIWIHIGCKKNILLEIKDDGIGFNTSKKSTGIGLINIKDRVELLNGSFYINSLPGKGCKIEISFPIIKNVNKPDISNRLLGGYVYN